jgi:CubicO group peptidase (beta-lactamase class C family)
MEHGLELSGKKLTLDTLIWPFFEKKIRLVNSSNKARLERVQLRHLLNHTTGHEEGLMFRDQIKNKNPDTLLDYVFNYDLTHDPGEHFAYSNAGPYIISALIHETLGINLSSWVSQLLLEPLEITRHEWKNYGKYCAAATGLKLFQTDLHKIGHLFLDNGRYKAQQVVPEHWIELMRTPNIKTSALYDETEPFPKYAYGYYMWICKGENYFCYGTDGQYLIVLPGSGIVITTLGQQTDMRPIAECFRVLL